MIGSLKTSLFLVLSAALSMSLVAGETLEVPATSPDIHLGHSLRVVSDEEATFYYGSGFPSVSFGQLPDAADVDAFHGLANGDVLFSLESSVSLDGVLYRPFDVIRFDGVIWSKEFDGAAEGIPNGVNVDAVAMSGGSLLLSVDITTTLDGATYDDSDVIAHDGAVFSLFLGTDTAGISSAADLDALHVDETGRVLVSFEGSGQLGGVDFNDEDLLAFDSAVWSMEFDGSADDSAWQAVDLDAWSTVFVDDNMFKDGYESEEF